MTFHNHPLSYVRTILSRHGAGRKSTNRHMIRLMYVKGALTGKPNWMDQWPIKTDDVPVDNTRSPVFIIGHWRSGTTHLQFLLNQDPNLFTLSKFQSFFPEGFPVKERYLKPLLTSLLSLTRPVKHWQQNISKSMEMDSPSETEFALINQFFPYTYHWVHFFPSLWEKYFRKYLFLDGIGEEAYNAWLWAYGSFLDKLYKYHSSGNLLVKNPGDTGRIEHLLRLYPNARFIFIHRNPYDVYYSNQKLWNNILQGISLEQLSHEEEQRLILTMYEKLHQSYFDQKPKLRSDQLVEIGHEELVKTPEHTLQKVYDQLDLPGFQEALPYFRDYVRKNAKWHKKQYSYDPQVLEMIDKHWAFAFERFGYQGSSLEEVS